MNSRNPSWIWGSHAGANVFNFFSFRKYCVCFLVTSAIIVGQLHIFSRNETQEQECTLLSKERCHPSQLKPKWKIWHSGWGFNFNLWSCEALDYRQRIGHNPEITKGGLTNWFQCFFFPLTKICEFSSSLLLSLFQKVLLSVFFFPILNFLYHSLKLLFFSNSLFLYILVESSLQ